jgi:type II secretory pathway component PulK
MPHHATTRHSTPRSGSALILVLVVIVLLSLGAYTYSELMITEYKASDAHARRLQSQLWAESGVEYVAALFGPGGEGWSINLDDNLGDFHVPVDEFGGFTVVAPVVTTRSGSVSEQATSAGIRFGLIDECARLNVNVLAAFEDGELAREMLMALPEMTEDVADAILDWIDEDDSRRPYGAEAMDYSFASPRNGPLDSIEELLLVAGVTPELLYGEDANRNGLLDPNEDDGDLSPPTDNSDGILDLGWAEYLTVHSRESNLRRSPDRYGEPKINVNDTLLTDLYDQLEEEFDEEVARFVAAYRMFGPVIEDEIDYDPDNPLAGSGGGGRGRSSTGDRETDDALERLAEGIAGAMLGNNDGEVTRGGLDLLQGGSVSIGSIYELIDAEVEAEIDGRMETLASPWSSSPGDLQATLPRLLDALTVTSRPVIRGRININQARREVLLAIPDMTPDLADAIIGTRSRRMSSGSRNDETISTAGWLLIEGLVDLDMMRRLDGYITARGEVFRLQVVGHSDRPGPMTRIEAIIDATEDLPRVLFQRNLSELGPGFRYDQLPRFQQP